MKYGDITNRQAGYAVKKFLKAGQPMLVTARFAQVDTQPRNQTDIRKYRRYLSLPRLTAPLAEGITPEAQSLTYEDIVVQLEQWGGWVQITDRISDLHTDPVLKIASEMLGEQSGRTLEGANIAVLTSGTNVFYANGVASRTLVDSEVKLNDFKKIYRFFRRNYCKPITKVVKMSLQYGSEPVGRSYFALGHTDLDADIRAIDGFVPIEKYANGATIIEGEIGKVQNFRFILTEEFSPWLAAGKSGTTYLSGGDAVSVAAACDVYPIVLFGQDAYATVSLQGVNTARIYAVSPGKPTKGDPFGMEGFVSWMMWHACVILNHAWLCRYEVAAKAL